MKKKGKILLGTMLLVLLLGATPLNTQAHSLNSDTINLESFLEGTQASLKESVKEKELEVLQNKRRDNKPDISLKEADNKQNMVINIKEGEEIILVSMPSDILEADGTLKITGLTEKQKVFVLVETKGQNELTIRRQLDTESLNVEKTKEHLFWIFVENDELYKQKIRFETKWQGQVIAPDDKLTYPQLLSSQIKQNKNISPEINKISPMAATQKDPNIDGEIVASAESSVGHSDDVNVEKPDAKENFEGILTIEVTEQGKPTIKLKDAYFSLFNSNDQLISDTLRTDTNGQVTLNKLKKGSYYVKQTKAPDKYELPKNSEQSFEISGKIENEKIALLFENKKQEAPIIDHNTKGTLLIIKEDESNNKIRLGGASFSIFQDNGVAVAQNLTTNSKGEIIFNDLNAGHYYLKETNAPNGYQINNQRFEFDIEKGKQTSVIVKGQKIPIINNGNNNQSNQKTQLGGITYKRVPMGNTKTLPQTGESEQFWLLSVGFSLLAASSIAVYLRWFRK